MAIYKVAGLNIKIEGDAEKAFLDRFLEYKTNEQSVHININIVKVSEQIFLQKDELVKMSPIEYWRIDEGFYRYYLTFDDIENAAVMVEYKNDFKNISVYMYDVKKALNYDDTGYLTNVMNTVFHYVMLMNGRIVLHSSAIEHNGYGVAFSADSGVGKSTHTNLWIEHVPNTQYINDDTPVLYMQNGQMRICGSPLAGSSGINKNMDVPLKSVVFVTRGKENKLSEISVLMGIALLKKQIVTPICEQMADRVFEGINDILSNVKCFIMECNISKEAAIVAENTIFCN